MSETASIITAENIAALQSRDGVFRLFKKNTSRIADLRAKNSLLEDQWETL